MVMMPDGASELTRLHVVQNRVRHLVRMHDCFAEAIRAAFDGFLALNCRFVNEQSALRARERQLARDLLGAGQLFDPVCRDNRPCLFVSIQGLCPAALAKRLEPYGRQEGMPAALERDGAHAALTAMDRDDVYQARDLPRARREAMAAEYRAAIAAGTHAAFSWVVVIAPPADWMEPADPHSLKGEHLRRFSEADYRTIALYCLGGLADAGAVRPIVPKPPESGDIVRDCVAFMAWRERQPVCDEDFESEDPPLSASRFPLGVAEQMLADVESWWIAVRADKERGDAERDRALSGAAGQSGRPAATASADDDLADSPRVSVRELSSAATPIEEMAKAHAAPLHGSGFPFRDDDITLLMELGGRSVLTQIAELDGTSGMPGYDRMADRFRAMESATPPLVERPSGPRSGYRLTQAGRDELSRRGHPPT